MTFGEMLPWALTAISTIGYLLMRSHRNHALKEEYQLAQFIVIMFLVDDAYKNHRSVFFEWLKSHPIEENDIKYLNKVIYETSNFSRNFIAKLSEPMISIIVELRRLKN